MPLNAQVARQQWLRYTYVRDTGHLDFVEKARRCENLFAGDHWDPHDRMALRDARRPGLTINKVLGTLSSILGEQIDLRTEIAYKARYGAPNDSADTLTKLFRFISDKNQLNYLRSEMFADGSITSRGYLDARMDFDNSVTGDVKISLINPKNVLPDPDAYDYDPDTWNDVIITRWMTADDIEYLYNAQDAEELRIKSTSSWAYGYDSIDRMRDRFAGSGPLGLYVTDDMKNVARMIRVIERQYRKLDKMKYFIDVKTGDRRRVPDSWDRDRIAMFVEQMQGRVITDDHVGHRIRWVVTADDYVLHDDWSPYKHFTVIPYFPYFRYGRTIGLVENLIDPQELLNKSTSQELHAINTMANSGWVMKRNNLVNMTPDELEQWGAKSGLVLEVEDIQQIQKIQPNQIPQGLSDLSRKGESFIKAVSMRGDAQTGMARADVSADQIDAQKANSDIGLRKPLENLTRSDFFLARHVLAMVQDYYTDPRIMNIAHNDLTGETQQVSINWPDPTSGEITNDITLGDYDVNVVSQAVKQTLEDTQFQQAVSLRKDLGIQIPDEFLIENSNLINKGALVKAIMDARNSEAAQMQQKMQQLGGQLQVSNLKAEGSRLEADAVLKRAKAAHTLAQTQNEAAGEPDAQAQMQLEQEKHTQEMNLSQQKHEQELQHEREKHQMEQQAKAQQAEDDRQLKRAQAIMALRQGAEKPQGAKPQEKAE